MSPHCSSIAARRAQSISRHSGTSSCAVLIMIVALFTFMLERLFVKMSLGPGLRMSGAVLPFFYITLHLTLIRRVDICMNNKEAVLMFCVPCMVTVCK